MSVHNDVCGSATLWKLYGASNNLVQELRLDDARFHTTPCAPKLVRSVAIFSFFLLLWKRLTIGLSLVSCQKGAWRKVFFSEKFNSDGSPVLPATAGQWVWLGDSSRELCTPVLPSIKLRLCWHGCPGSCLRLVFVYFGLCYYFKLGSVWCFN